LIDPEPIVDRANDVIERLFALGDEDRVMANANAFCALLKDLHERPIVEGPHAHAICRVRAGMLRGAIGTVMACLDPSDWRGNRESIGQILDEMLKDKALAEFFVTAGKGLPTALQQAKKSYEDLSKSGAYKRERRLRDKAIAHTLNTPPPEARYEDLYELVDRAGTIVVELYTACGRGTPQFLAKRGSTAERAKLFWTTYFLGMPVQDELSRRL
jgi:AbiU2